MSAMEVTNCAYLAAFLDADGWITIVPRNNRTTYGAMVGVVNRHKPVLEWIQSLFGGSLKARNISRKGPACRNWSQTYDLNFRADEIPVVLNAVMPYLKVKKRQAELVLELLTTYRDISKEYRVPIERKVIKEELYQEIRQLNHAGLTPSLIVVGVI